MPTKKIAIIGGGVIGTSCAVHIAEQFDRQTIDVHIIAEDFTPDTTGDGSAGLWGPFLLDATPHEQIMYRKNSIIFGSGEGSKKKKRNGRFHPRPSSPAGPFGGTFLCFPRFKSWPAYICYI